MMGGWAGWGGFGMGFGSPFMILFWALVILAVIAAAKWLVTAGPASSASRASKALETLKERYARGEIGREEYEQKRRDLSS